MYREDTGWSWDTHLGKNTKWFLLLERSQWAQWLQSLIYGKSLELPGIILELACHLNLKIWVKGFSQRVWVFHYRKRETSTMDNHLCSGRLFSPISPVCHSDNYASHLQFVKRHLNDSHTNDNQNPLVWWDKDLTIGLNARQKTRSVSPLDQ